MSESIFDNKSIKPGTNELNEVLGSSSEYWNDFRRHIEAKFGPLTEDWKFYNQKSGWILKVLRKKSNLFFMIPVENYFKITFVFGEKAVSVVEKSDLPKEIIKTLKDARKYMEGRGIQIEVKDLKDVKNINELVEIKVNN
jgi:hypothetical protein